MAKKTNIFLSGDSPAIYVPRIEKTSGLGPEQLDAILSTHLIDAGVLRGADFQGFFDARRTALLELIEAAMGKPSVRDVSDAPPGTHGEESPEAFEAMDDDLEPDDLDLAEEEELSV